MSDRFIPPISHAVARALKTVAVLTRLFAMAAGVGQDDASDVARQRGVFVLGHPNYYPRFGFSRDRARSLASPFPAEAFMALELLPGALDDIRGSVRYPDAFGLQFLDCEGSASESNAPRVP